MASVGYPPWQLAPAIPRAPDGKPCYLCNERATVDNRGMLLCDRCYEGLHDKGEA